MSICEIPQELLEKIFRSVYLMSESHSFTFPTSGEQEDLVNCALVCKSWHLPVCRVLYEEIKLNNIRPLSQCLAMQSQNNGVFCEELRFLGNFLTRKRPLQEYKELFSFLPKLETINLDYCSLLRKYHLEQINQSSELLQHVKEITPGIYTWSVKELQTFYNCAYVLRNTLQRIKLSASNSIIRSTDGRSGNILSLLSDLTNLTSLEITNLKERPTSDPQLVMFSILRSCPNLVRFRLNNKFREPEDENSNNNINHSKLRCMEITLPELTKSHINYMASNINGLKQLMINIGFPFDMFVSQRPIHWLEKIGPECLTHLQKYLSSIEKVEFNTGSNIGTETTNLFSFVNNLVSNITCTPIHVSVKLANLKDESDERKMFLEKGVESVFVHCGIEASELVSDDDKITLSSFLQKTITPLAMNEKEMKSLHIQSMTGSHEREIYALRLNILDTIINRFTNTHYFNMQISLSDYESYQIKLASNEVDHNNYTYITDYTDLRLPRRPSIPSDTLAYVTLTHIQSTKEIISILHMLPNTKHLMIDCELDFDENLNYTLDLSSLSDLQILKLDVATIAYQVEEKQIVVLQIEQEKSDRILYYKWEREKNNFESMKFEAIEADYITKSERFMDPKVYIIFIKSQEIKRIDVCAGKFINDSLALSAH